MPKVDNIVNVTDDSLVHRELIDMDSTAQLPVKLRCNYARMVQELHQERLERYARKRMISQEKATYELIRLHREKVNVASHMSYIIGDNHQRYMKRLTDLHENPWFIR
jgi:hypothetical protein